MVQGYILSQIKILGTYLYLLLLFLTYFLKGQLVTTYTGTFSRGDVDGSLSEARFYDPTGVVFDGSGNLFVVDAYNHKIRKITPAGIVSTFAGTGTIGSADGTGTAASFNYPWGIAIDASNNLFVTDGHNNKIRKITASGVVTTFAGSGTVGSADGWGASFNNPYGIAVDNLGNVYVADLDNHKIRKINPSGYVTTLAGSGTAGSLDATGLEASFNKPTGIAVDASRNLYVVEEFSYKIRKITPLGVVSTFVGSGTDGTDDGIGTSARFGVSFGICIDNSSNLYVSDYSHCTIRKVAQSGLVVTIAGTGELGYVDGIGRAAGFSLPAGMTLDASGNLYIAELYRHRIRKLAPIPEIKISQNNNELMNGTGSYNFGTISSNSTTITFTIENVAPTEKILSLTGVPKVEISGSDQLDFSVDISNTSSNVAVGQSTTFSITFAPLSTGSKTATITVLNDDIDEGQYTFTVTGNSIITEIDNSAIIPNVTFYPNPTAGNLSVMAPQSGQIIVQNVQGLKMLEQKIVEGSNIISVENFPAGLYILSYLDGKLNYQMPFIKN